MESSVASYLDNMSIYFHRVNEGESFESIAAKYSVDIERILNDNCGITPAAGEIVVINLKGIGKRSGSV